MQEFILSFHYTGSRDQIPMVGFCDKYLDFLTHLPAPDSQTLCVIDIPILWPGDTKHMMLNDRSGC